MSYERRLWSRQEVSFPYIVVCWSASRILMLEGDAGLAACAKSMTLGQWLVGKQGRKRDQSAPWLLKQHLPSGREGKYFISQSLFCKETASSLSLLLDTHFHFVLVPPSTDKVKIISSL